MDDPNEQYDAPEFEPVQAPRPARPSRRVIQNFMCIGCGYNIRGQVVDSLCPECGTPVMHSMGQPAPTSGFAIASLVLGILSVVGCSLYGLPSIILGPLAIIFASKAKKRTREGTAGGSTVGLATAGNWCGIVGLALGLVGVILIGLMFVGMMLPGQFP